MPEYYHLARNHCISQPRLAGLANFHLAWFSTGTFCLNVWKLLLSSIPRNVQQHTQAIGFDDLDKNEAAEAAF
jgi:hypothetical protein